MQSKARVNIVRRVPYPEGSSYPGSAQGLPATSAPEGHPYEEDGWVYDSRAAEPAENRGRALALGLCVLMLVTVFSAVAWLLTAGSSGGSTNSASLQVAARVGAIAPDFQLVDVHTNKPVKLSSLRGKPIFMNFWGTWCPPCRAEMPEMQKVHDKYGDQIAMVGISMGPRDTAGGVKSFVDQAKYNWTFVQDDDFQVATQYQAYSIPTSYFIDKKGVIRAVHIGAMDTAKIEGYLEQAR